VRGTGASAGRVGETQRELVLGDAYRNILVAYDGNEGGRAALRRAAELAAVRRSPLTVVQATSQEEAAARLLDGVVGGLQASLEIRPRIARGPAGQAILAVASDIEADLIVAGARSRGRFATATALGSVSTELAHRAPCDVLLIPPYSE
jgi:nucleotide-binding universal stress UspA family protein